MKQRVFKFVCIVLLLCSVLIVLPACAADFEESYLPITSIAETDITVGMATDDFYSLLESLEENHDYVNWHSYFFLRSSNGRSMLIERDIKMFGKIVNVYTYDVSNLATKQDFRQLHEGMTIPQVVEKVGLPVYVNPYISYTYKEIVFPVADGSTCHIVFMPFDKIENQFDVGLRSISFSYGTHQI